MPPRSSDDLWRPLALLALGMLAPGLVLAAAADLVSMYASAGQLVVAVAVAYGLVAWLLVERAVIDRMSFLLVSLVWPWLLLFGLLFTLLLLNEGEQIPQGPAADVFRSLTSGWPGFFGYAAVFAVAGLAAVGLSGRYRALTRRDPRVPEPRRVIVGLALLVGGLLVVIGTVNAATATAASVTSVGPGTQTFEEPTLNVSVEGPAAELRVTAVAPDGTRATQRLSRAEMRGGVGRVAFPITYDDSPRSGVLPARPGVYRVRVTALAGLTVDTGTFSAEAGAAASMTAVTTANGTLPWEERPERVYERGAGETKLGLTIVNEGAFPAELALTVDVPGGPIDVRRVFLTAGQRAGVVVSLPAETVRAVRTDSGGTVTVTLFYAGHEAEPVTSVEVELPGD